MKNLIIVLILILFSFNSLLSQKKDNSSFIISMNMGGNIFPDDGNFRVLDRYTLNAKNWEIGYRINPIHEAGIIIGSSDFSYSGYQILNFQNNVYVDTVSIARSRNWIGVYYIYHIKNIMHTGVRFAHFLHGGTYHEFFVGKEIPIEKNILVRTNINVANNTTYLFGFSREDIPVAFGFTIGFCALF
jgi:hypothetical protein